MRSTRFEVISDVHGNLPALQAVHPALAKEDPLDRVIVAGDLLLSGPWPNEAWDVLTADGYVLVQGNTDAALAGQMDPVLDPGHPYQQAYAERYAWTLAQIDGATHRALGKLPREHRVSTPAGDLLVVHVSPRGLDDRARAPHNTAADVAAAYGGTGASAVAFGTGTSRSFVLLLSRCWSMSQACRYRSIGAPLLHTQSSRPRPTVGLLSNDAFPMTPKKGPGWSASVLCLRGAQPGDRRAPCSERPLRSICGPGDAVQ
jgi:calcineurin-like phosphoesterase family protein